MSGIPSLRVPVGRVRRLVFLAYVSLPDGLDDSVVILSGQWLFVGLSWCRCGYMCRCVCSTQPGNNL